MYVRPPNYRYPSSVRIPENYSGSTFREQDIPAAPTEVNEAQSVQEDEVSEVLTDGQEEVAAEQASLLSPRPFRLRLGSILGKKNGIGTEELLILALILLLSDNDDGFDDLILFLALLFFIR